MYLTIIFILLNNTPTFKNWCHLLPSYLWNTGGDLKCYQQVGKPRPTKTLGTWFQEFKCCPREQHGELKPWAALMTFKNLCVVCTHESQGDAFRSVWAGCGFVPTEEQKLSANTGNTTRGLPPNDWSGNQENGPNNLFFPFKYCEGYVLGKTSPSFSLFKTFKIS